jgi:hypothetical protein
MHMTISDLWFLTYEGMPVDLRAPLFSSRQVLGEVQRANRERRDGRRDWLAVDLEAVILIYGETRASIALRDLGETRHYLYFRPLLAPKASDPA